MVSIRRSLQHWRRSHWKTQEPKTVPGAGPCLASRCWRVHLSPPGLAVAMGSCVQAGPPAQGTGRPRMKLAVCQKPRRGGPCPLLQRVPLPALSPTPCFPRPIRLEEMHFISCDQDEAQQPSPARPPSGPLALSVANSLVNSGVSLLLEASENFV